MSARAIKGERYTLYGRPGSGSSCVEAMLALTGANHAIVDIGKADTQAQDRLKALNPLGQVPTLVLPSGETMTESAAILIHLADLVPAKKLAPPIGDPARALFLRLMVYLSANLYMSFLRYYYPDRYTADPTGAAAVKAAAAARIDYEWDVFAGLLAPGRFALGEEMSVVDLYAAMLIDWSADSAALVARQPRLGAIADGVASSPAVAPVWKRNGIAPPKV